MRVLDLGCGPGKDLIQWGVSASDDVTGVDIDDECLLLAKARFPSRKFVQSKGEYLPFNNESFDRVICAVALPYMNIPRALQEIHRVLAPGGRLTISLYPPSIARWELRHVAIPKGPYATLFRLYVITNGIFFHATGKTVRFPSGRTESFQTERGTRIALARAKFGNFVFRRWTGPVWETFHVEARKVGIDEHG